MIVMHVGDAKKAEGIQKIAKDLGEKVLSIGGKDLDRTLISFSMGKEMRKNMKLPPLYAMPELLLFVGMADAKLDLFLEKYRNAGLAPIALKAVSTKHNAQWTVYELIGRLQEEAAIKV